MDLQVHTRSGTGFELLVAAAAVADADWRQVFTHGPAAHAAVRRTNPGLVAETRRFGRFGWINLAGPLAATRAAGTRSRLVQLVERTAPDDLRWIMVGGRRRQLRTRVADDVVRSALAGDRAALTALRAATADTLLQVTPWLLRTPGEEVRETCLRVLEAFPALDARAPSATATARALADLGPAGLLERVAPGIHYGPDVLGRVVLVTSVRTAPILVAVDEIDQTVILHPPLTDGGTTDAGAQLREIGRALGDDTRIRVLQQLRTAERTLPELRVALDAPRTTLLHHLALLRAAGLVELGVRAGSEPNVYVLSPGGFETLATAARAFTTR